MRTGEKIHGFEVAAVHDLEEYRAKGIWLRHEGTGAEVYHVYNDDVENLCSFTFKTLPVDSKGTAHILEHTVLCGSERYPLKDPFVLLIKGSLNTFLNAFTFPDKTVYPVASTVEKDLFNLMRVYADAVFFPLLKPEMFRQEGSRLQFSEDGSLEVTGVVYNEMKGNYSTHDGIAGEWAYRSLFPDTPYSYDSGGEPSVIRDLSYEEFLQFHRTYYHPSNVRIFLYGNVPTEKYLELLHGEYLSKFEKLNLEVAIPLQKRWTEPVEKTVSYPTQAGEGADSKSSVSVNWLLSQITDPKAVLETELLAEILLGDSGAPLEKALIESGLGEDLSPVTGLETELRELVFSVGLRGTEPDRKSAIEEVIFSTLTALRDNGLDPDLVEGVMRRVEFRNREIKGSPFGLRLMRKALRGWLHGATPATTLEFARWFAEVRSELEQNPKLFETLIDRHFLSNRHRSTLVVVPDVEMQKREQAEVQEWLAEKERSFSNEDRARIKREQEELLAFQETPDSPEAVQSIPFLHVPDLPKDVELIPSRTERILGGVPLISHDFFTNGVVYIDISVDVSALPPSLSGMLPLYTSAFRDCGIPGVPYDELAKRLSLLVGGFSASLEANVVHGSDAVKQHVIFRVKVMEAHLHEALDLVRRVLLEADFANTRRVKDLFLELRNEFKSSVIPGGNSYVRLRADRAFSLAEAVEENWRGVTRLLEFAKVSPENEIAAISEQLLELRSVLMRISRFTVNVTCNGDFLATSRDLIRDFLSGFPAGSADDLQPMTPDVPDVPAFEALVVPASVGYVAMTLPASAMGHPDHAHEVVLAHLLSTGYLWEQIRMKGGAYGASASANGLGRMFSFSSYRDPNIIPTLGAYRDGLASYAKTVPDGRSVELGIIGTVGRDLRPFSPGDKGLIGFKRHLYGITDEVRQTKRDQILSTSPADLKRSAERLIDAASRAVVVAMSGASALDEAGNSIPGFQQHRLDIPL